MNYVGRLMDRNPEEQERLNFYSDMANDMLEKGIEYRKKSDEKTAKEFFSIAWAYYSILESDICMRLCDENLKRIGVEGDELFQCHEYGAEMVEFGDNLVGAVDKLFREKRNEK